MTWVPLMDRYGGPVLVPDNAVVEWDDIAQRLVDGEHEALAEAYQRWSSLIYTFALRALGDRCDAEEVTQQVFVSAWFSRHTLRPGTGVVAGWLVGIAKHRIADVRTERYRARRNLDAVASMTPPQELHRRDEDLGSQLLVAHALTRLGEPRASVLRMAVIEDRPSAEIARVLGLPLGTVKSHLRRGLLQLRSQLKEA